MTRNDINNAPKCAGIYCIKNTINNKCYIGQAIKLQKRLKSHWNNYNNEKYSHIILYQAIKKYGIENFELIILKKIINALDWRTKSELDKLEKEYIKEYDSYNNGYNSTLGGDGGVLGYHHTDENKQLLSQKAKLQFELKNKELGEKQENWVKCKNLETNEILLFNTAHDLSQELNIHRIVVYNCLNKRQKIAYKKYQIAYYAEEFETLPDYGTEDFEDLLKTQFKSLSNKEEICKYLLENPSCSYGEIKQTFELSKKTFYNYKKELNISSEQRIDTKVPKEEFIEYYNNHTKEECLNHFNIKERLFYKYKTKYLSD